ncbi:hypothetical protein SDC9_172697 [bioreactor metagenome]|uniref:DNA methylase adenine-specific domain-containing protein n=1 Tax=bioreactor metagenome TaxID=1076179 RepID=A0A645GGL9_9ZZZZ
MMMARIGMSGTIEENIQKHGYISVSEPTCGSGGMVIAMAEELKQLGYNPTSKMWVVAQDIDRKCCCMAYIQLTLLAIPAAIIWGDTLRVECREQWITTGYFLGNWASRFRMERASQSVFDLVPEQKPEAAGVLAPAIPPPPDVPAGQLMFDF